jgi:hypothetical protein
MDNQQVPPVPQTPQGILIDVDSIIAKIEMPPNLKKIFDKAVLSGMRIMFDRKSHQMLLDQLDKPGDMAQKLAEGIITLTYMLWTQSNKTLPPQIMVPLTTVLTLKAFDFLQKSGEPEATKEVLGEGMHLAVTGVMERFGVDEAQLEQMAAQKKGSAPVPGGAPAPGGAQPAATSPAKPGGMIQGV